MGKLKNLDLKFSEVPVYPGTVLKGSVRFFAKDAVSIKNIVLKFEGSSKINWAGDGTAGNGKEHWFFKVELPMTNYITQNASSKFGGKNRLGPGDHSVPFQFPVPQNVPASFGGKFGYVYYCCKAIITTAGNSEIRIEKAIPVCGVEDLNWHPYATAPYSSHEHYTQRILCLKLANVSAILQLPRTAFCPGDTVDVAGEIINKSKRQKVPKSGIQLIQTVNYSCDRKNKTEVKIVSEKSLGEVNPESMMKLEEEPFKVPPLPPSFLRGCEDIEIHYQLVFYVDPGIKFVIPIIIGTIPFSPDSLKKVARAALPWKEQKLPSKGGKGFKEFETNSNGKLPKFHLNPPFGNGFQPRPPNGHHMPPHRMSMPMPPPGVPPPGTRFRPPPPPGPGRPRPRSTHGMPGAPPPPIFAHPRMAARPMGSMPGLHRGGMPGQPRGVPFGRHFGPPPPRGPPMGPGGFRFEGPPPRKNSSRPYVTEAPEEGESTISKRRESDTARPHGVLKIEEIE